MKIVSLRLASGVMTQDEIDAERRRRGYWLRMAREHAGPDGGPITQAAVAEALGRSKKSGSSISDLEKGLRDASATELTRLARLYGVPVSWFSEPRPTDLEDLLRAKQLAAGAVEAEAEDWASAEPEEDRAVEGGGAAEPRRLRA